jgi:hypothetical protein
MKLWSYLTSPVRTLDREREQRERELYAAFARGRRLRWERARLDRR